MRENRPCGSEGGASELNRYPTRARFAPSARRYTSSCYRDFQSSRRVLLSQDLAEHIRCLLKIRCRTKFDSG
jgi:hypothetical protein